MHVQTDLRARVDSLMPLAREDLAELVEIPSVADPRQFPPEDCDRAALWVRDAFARVGFLDARLVPTADGSNAVVGSRRVADPDAPTVLLNAHYDVQPPLHEDAWRTPPFELTEVDGRWYGRGSSDCKGNIVMLLTALRALDDDLSVNVKLAIEGSEEQGTGGLEELVPQHPELFRADAILVCDTGNAAVGRPAATVSLRGMVNVVVTVDALETPVHSGMFGGPAPDALLALIAMLATLHDAHGDTTVAGLPRTQAWTGEEYPAEQFRRDAGLVDGAALLGDGSVSDMLWARPAVTVLGIDCPPVVGSAAAIPAHVAARLNLRIPPGVSPDDAAAALDAQLRAAAPWGVRVGLVTEAQGAPFRAADDGPAYAAIREAMLEAYGTPMAALGQGGSIPLCTVFADEFPEAELVLMGVEEPMAAIHAPNESVDPREIAMMALVQALFLQRFGVRSA